MHIPATPLTMAKVHAPDHPDAVLNRSTGQCVSTALSCFIKAWCLERHGAWRVSMQAYSFDGWCMVQNISSSILTGEYYIVWPGEFGSLSKNKKNVAKSDRCRATKHKTTETK